MDGAPQAGPAPLGLIAGNGRFPFLVAAAGRRAGRRVVAVAIKEETDPALAGEVDEIHWVSLGQLGRCIDALKSGGVREAVMAGQVKHKQIFSGIVPDLKMMALLARLALKNTDSLIGAVADALGREGIALLSSTALLQDQLATPGAMTRRRPSGDEQKDVEYGREVARALAGFDVGQTVVVKDRAAVAVEAMEGTDEAIRRAGRIAGPGCTVVKVAKPRQDVRFDVPVVGPGHGGRHARGPGAATLAVQAGATLLAGPGRPPRRGRPRGRSRCGGSRPRPPGDGRDSCRASRRVRVGVVGVGALGQHHARVYAALPGARLAGVYDIDRGAGGRGGRPAMAGASSTHVRDLLAEVDAVSVAVPTADHHRVGRASCSMRARTSSSRSR